MRMRMLQCGRRTVGVPRRWERGWEARVVQSHGLAEGVQVVLVARTVTTDLTDVSGAAGSAPALVLGPHVVAAVSNDARVHPIIGACRREREGAESDSQTHGDLRHADEKWREAWLDRSYE